MTNRSIARRSTISSNGRASIARSSTRAGFADARAVGGLDAIAALPLTEKDELRASRTPDEPIGTHLTAAADEIARIYSTSGTTGRAELHSAHRRRSRSLGAHVGALLRGFRRRARRAPRLDLQRRALRRRRGARRLRPARPLPHPRRLGEHRAADGGGRSPQAHRRGDDAVLRAASRGMGARARHGPRQVEREAGDGGGRAGRRRARDARQARGGLGRERHRGDGHRRHFRFSLGRMRAKSRHAFFAAGALSMSS